MNEGFGMRGILSYRAYHDDGTVFAEGVADNQVQDNLFEFVIDAISGTSAHFIRGMAIGTGSGQDLAADVLATKDTQTDLGAGGGSTSQVSATHLSVLTTFTGRTATITEAGMFPAAACTEEMWFYNDGLNVVLTATDTLQLEWSVISSSTV